MKTSCVDMLRSELGEMSKDNDRLRANVAELMRVDDERDATILKLTAERNVVSDRADRQERDLERRTLERDDARKALAAMQAESDRVREECEKARSEAALASARSEDMAKALEQAAQEQWDTLTALGSARAHATILAKLVQGDSRAAALGVADVILAMRKSP